MRRRLDRLGRSAADAYARAALVVALFCTAGCSEDMRQQPSFQPQEAPRKHSPPHSIPRESRVVPLGQDEIAGITAMERQRLFAVNCTHCHGQDGVGDGPAAGYLKELPANLRAPHVQRKSAAEIYQILTNGEGMMPSFRGELSTNDRWALAEYVADLNSPRPPAEPDGQ